MNEVFADYAHYYDLLYKDKDYAGEATYVSELLRYFGNNGKELLDVGCGTARHDFELSKQGYRISGIDLSETMLEQAKSRVPAGRFLCASSESFKLEKQFDAVISLFHVMSYHTTEKAAANFMSNVYRHLAPGGVFIFDFWYGPAVLREPPSCRTKTFEDDKLHVVRCSTPDHDSVKHTVKVHFDVSIKEKESGVRRTLLEDHFMRYWFPDELCLLAAKWFDCRACFRYLTKDPASAKDWSAIIILKRKESE